MIAYEIFEKAIDHITSANQTQIVLYLYRKPNNCLADINITACWQLRGVADLFCCDLFEYDLSQLLFRVGLVRYRHVAQVGEIQTFKPLVIVAKASDYLWNFDIQILAGFFCRSYRLQWQQARQILYFFL